MKRLALGTLVAALALVVLPGSAFGRSLVVGDGGAGCRDARYATIQAAVNAARPGDQVPVCPGTYREHVTVGTRGLKIVSRKRHAAVVQVPEELEEEPAFDLDAGAVLLRGFTLLPSDGPCQTGDPGVEVSANVTIDYNRIMSAGCHSFRAGIVELIHPDGPGRFTVAHNEISGFDGFGVFARGGSSAINSNTVRGGFSGIQVRGGRSVVQDNTVEDASATGVVAYGLDQGAFVIRIAGNRLRRNGSGISAQYLGEGQNFPVPAHARIEGNTVLDSVGDGIAVEFAPGLVVRNRSLRSGGFDCVDRTGGVANPTIWKDNVGVTDSPSNLCRAP